MSTETTTETTPQPQGEGNQGQQPPAPEPTPAPQPPQPVPTPQPSVAVEDHRGEEVPEHLRAGQQEKTKADTSGDIKAKDPIEELNKLEPYGDQKIWVLGKPPELDGKENEWLRCYQRPLGYMAKMRFFALLADTIGKALEGGQTIEDLLREAGVVGGNRNLSLSSMSGADLSDIGSVMPVVMRLVSSAPNFLLDAYCILLDVPAGQRAWAKMVMEQPYRPEAEQWGLTDDQGVEIIEIAIDQNYEPIREFFVGKLPRIAARARSKEGVRELPSAQ